METMIKNFIVKKRSVIVVTALALGFIGICLISRSQKSVDDTLTIGMMSGWPPFMSINQQGAFEGFDVDVAQELARRMGKKLVIQDVGSLAACFIALEKNRVDAIMSGLDITQERMNKLEMVPYTGQGVNEFTLLFWNQIPAGVTTIQDLEKLPNPIVIVEPGVATEKYLARFSFITKKQISALQDQLLDLKYGKSQALFLEPQVARRLMNKNPELKSLRVPLPPEFQIFGMGIAIKKDNRECAKKVQAAIDAMKADGTVTLLETKWQVSGVSNEF